MAAYNKFEVFTGDLGLGYHGNMNTNQFKVYLTNATPDAAADTIKGDLAEITAENGYTALGDDVTNLYSEASGTGTLTGTDVVWTASGGTIGPFQHVVMYNVNSTTNLLALISWWDYGSAVTLQDGETFTVDFGASIFTIT